MKRKLAALVAAAAFALTTTAFAAGLFPGFPIVGNASYCGGFNQAGVPGTTPVCTVTVPAGPTTVTGNELIPADTQLSQGQSPQTVLVPLKAMNAGPYQYAAPLTATSVTLSASTRRLMLEPAGTIAALTVVWPAAAGLIDNQTMGICSRQVVTALTTTNGSGATVLDAPTALTAPLTTGAASCVEWVYRVANTSWYRVQ
jgi:hypothetical protein